MLNPETMPDQQVLQERAERLAQVLELAGELPFTPAKTITTSLKKTLASEGQE